MKSNLFVSAFMGMSVMFAACSSDDDDRVSGGVSEDAGFVADVAGVAQKGPFVKGSAVTVRGIDCKTLEFTDQVFEGAVKSDKGDFVLDSVTLDTSCAVVEVTGKYLNEVTGKKSSGELTLRALSDLKDRKNVNVNLLTNLEYERVMYLVKEKNKTLAKAKTQAEKEVLAAFDIKGEIDEFEDLNVFEPGDGNAALLAVSVMMQGNTDAAGLAKRLDKFAEDVAEDGKWDDDKTKAEIAEWAAAAANGELDSIRKNIEGLGYGDSIPAFEKYIPVVTSADGDSVILSEVEGSSSSDVIGSETKQSSSSVSPADSVNSSSSSVTLSEVEGSSSSSAKVDAGSEYDAAANTLKDLRDGKVYKTVTIEDQIWMAENLNYEVENSFCYKNSADSCAKYGRLYTWTAAMDSVRTGCGNGLMCSPTLPVQGACPSGWHLPSNSELSTLIMAAGGPLVAGEHLKAGTDWYRTGRGTDAFGFTALPAGWSDGEGFYNVGNVAHFWSSSERDSTYVYSMSLDYSLKDASMGFSGKGAAFSVRCLKDGSPAVVSSSSGFAISSSSVASSSSVKIAWACKRNTSDDCEYDRLTDDRDGQTYKTVKIGEQWWMAENLNYASLQPTDSLDSTSFCYRNNPSNCEEYGRLYLWSAVMDSAATWSENGKGCGYGAVCTPTTPVRGVCPAGWHVPNRDEVMELIDAVGGIGVAGEMLVSEYAGCIDQVDLYGFTFLPSGRIMSDGDWDDLGLYGYMWTTTEDYWNSDELIIRDSLEYELVVALSISKAGGNIGLHGYGKKVAFPVRCIKD